MRPVFALRATVSLWFAARIIAWTAPGDETFDIFADYLIADGILGSILAGLLVREGVAAAARRERLLSVVVLVDALGRIASGGALHIWPGISGFPVTIVVFLGVMAVSTAAIGVSEATLVIQEEVARHGRRHSSPQLPTVPVALASLAAIGFALASIPAIDDPDRLRPLLGGHIASGGGVMLGMARSRRRR